MSARFLAVAVALLTMLFTVAAQDDDDVVRVNTNLVTVPMSVLDRQGRFVPNLSREQFHLFENGVEQEIAYFESAEKPFTVALLLDTSDSTKFQLTDIQNAAIAFTEQLRPDDHVLVAVFDKRVTILAEVTNDRASLRSSIMRAETGRGTSLYNAVEMIVRQRLNRIRGRKAMVIFTDGVDTTSGGATYEGTLHTAQELDALVYAIQYDTFKDLSGPSVTSKGESQTKAYARANLYMNLLADRTGGRFYSAGSLKVLNKNFALIAQELRQQYSIGYYPKHDTSAGARRIKVRVDTPGVVVRARRSYVFKPITQK